MYLITYECNGRKAYDTTENIIDWLLSVNEHYDAPYFILNTIILNDDEFEKVDGVLIGM